jgi:hypothetical protein
MRLAVATYPTPWKKGFAILPQPVSKTEDVWLEFYEYRWLSTWEYESRAIGSGDTVTVHCGSAF